MGVGRTSNRALGIPAVRLLPLAAIALLGGCSSVAQISAVVTGGIAGASTGSPAVGFAVGVATDAAANYVVRYVGRVRQGAEQDAIAQVAGALPMGSEADWKIEHTIPVGDERGQLRIIRALGSPLAECREVAFSVQEDKARHWFTSDVCKQADGWKWASAEPAIARWGYLQ